MGGHNGPIIVVKTEADADDYKVLKAEACGSCDGRDRTLREGKAGACPLEDGVALPPTQTRSPLGAAAQGTPRGMQWEPAVENMQGSGLQLAASPESSLSQNWLQKCEIWGQGGM